MKKITKKKFLKLSEEERCRVLIKIIKGQMKFVGEK